MIILGRIIGGIFCILLGIYQCYRTVKLFNFEKEKGNENTSPFLMMSLFSSGVFGVALLGIGIAIAFNLF